MPPLRLEHSLRSNHIICAFRPNQMIRHDAVLDPLDKGQQRVMISRVLSWVERVALPDVPSPSSRGAVVHAGDVEQAVEAVYLFRQGVERRLYAGEVPGQECGGPCLVIATTVYVTRFPKI
jgi:hypothetical protein